MTMINRCAPCCAPKFEKIEIQKGFLRAVRGWRAGGGVSYGRGYGVPDDLIASHLTSMCEFVHRTSVIRAPR